jgi:hypothetical protein
MIPEGSSRSGDLSVLGRSITIQGRLEGTLVAVQSTVVIDGTVTGDAILLGGEIHFGKNGRVERDLLLVGADAYPKDLRSPSVHVGGRSLGLAAVEAAFLAELETSPMAGAAVSPLFIAFRLGLLSLWLVLGLALLFLRPRAVIRASESLRDRLASTTLLGLVAVLTGIILSTLLFLWVPAQVSLILIGLLAGGLFAGKVFGLAAICLLVGRMCVKNAKRGSLFFGDPAALSVGLLALGSLSLLPGAGPIIWSLASIVAIGVSVLVFFIPAEPAGPI